MIEYIVKNCPSLKSYAYPETLDWCKEKATYCQCVTDCPIKQVVELCKKETGKEVHRWGDVVLNKNNPLAEKILQTLDVQEVE